MNAQSARFFSGIADVPLMAGVTELTDQAAVFDKPEGRVAQGVASVAVGLKPSEVEDFYAQTLPQLGWRRISPRDFRRGDEHLALSFEAVNAGEHAGENLGYFLRVLVKPVSLQ